MKDKLYLATSVFKYYAGEKKYIFKVIQPLFGTYDEEKKLFQNFNGKEYYEILDKKIIQTDLRVGFYNLVKLSSLEDEFHTDNLEQIVSMYFEKYKNIGYLFDGICLSSFDYEVLKMIRDGK